LCADLLIIYLFKWLIYPIVFFSGISYFLFEQCPKYRGQQNKLVLPDWLLMSNIRDAYILIQ